MFGRLVYSIISHLRAGERTIVAGYQITLQWLVRPIFPVASHGIVVSIRALYYVTVFLVIGGLAYSEVLEIFGYSVVASPDTIFRWIEIALYRGTSNSFYLGLGFIAWYTIGAVSYIPSDKKKYRFTTAPDNKHAEWMHLGFALTIAFPTTGFFLLRNFDNYSEWMLVGGLGVITYFCLGKGWLHYVERYTYFYPDDPKKRERSGQYDKHVFHLRSLVGLCVLGLLIADSISKTSGALLFHLGIMGFVARRVRWTLYEDTYGFETTNPSVKFWNSIVRIPLLFAVILLVTTETTTNAVIVVSIAPIVGGSLYLLYRYWQLNYQMAAITYGDNELASDAEVHRRNDKAAAIFGVSIDRKEMFQDTVHGFNRTMMSLKKEMHEEYGRWDSPRVLVFSDDPEEFDPENMREKLDEIEEFLDERRDRGEPRRKLGIARTQLESVIEKYEYYQQILEPEDDPLAEIDDELLP